MIIITLIEYLLVAAAAVWAAVLFFRDARVRFLSVLALMVVLGLRTERDPNSILEYLAAALFTGSLLYIIIKHKFIDHTPFVPSSLFIFFSLYLVWGGVVGLTQVIGGGTGIERWYRDLLLFVCPLFLLPVFYYEIIKEKYDAEKILLGCLFSLWIIISVASIVKMRHNVVQAFYLYEIGTARIDNINAGFMIFVFFSLAMITEGKKRWLLLVGLILSIATLAVSFGRTAWIATIVLLPVVFFLGDKKEKIRGLQFMLMACAVILPLFAAAFFLIPLVRLTTVVAVDKLLSSSHLGTDLSMYNRYVEWRYALHHIVDSPIAGFGFGASFADYDWLRGFARQTPYIHNAGLTIMLKTGVIGVILISIPCIGYFLKGMKYFKGKFLDVREKAFLRAGIGLMLFALILGYTTPVFIERDESLYIALFWCFIIGIEHKITERQKFSMLPVTSE